MSGVIYTNTTIAAVDQDDGAQEVALDEQARLATKHQIAIDPVAATSGTLAVKVKPFGSADFEALLDSAGSAVTIDLAAPKTKIFEGRIVAWRLEPTTVNGTYNAAMTGWQ